MDDQIKNLLDSEIQSDIIKRLEISKQVKKLQNEVSNLTSEINRKNKAKNLFLGIKEPKKFHKKKEDKSAQ